MLTLVLVAICSGAIITNSGYRPFFLSFTLPVLGGLSVAWGLNPHHVVDSLLASIVSIMIVVMLVTFVVMSQETFNAFDIYVEATERQKALADELSIALKKAEDAQNSAENSDNSKSRFLAAASHDLRQPVYVLTLYSAVLARSEVSLETRKVIDNMNIAIESLSSEIEILLDISRLDSGAVIPDKTAVNLEAIMGKLEPGFSTLATNKGIVFHNKIHEPCVVWTDADMLSQMLRNICGNAIEYTSNGSVTLTVLRCENNEVVISIADTGIGISKENLVHVLEEFYQISNPERDNGMGLGLGLSIVDRLAKSLGHELLISSVQGSGTKVSIKMQAGSAEGIRRDRETKARLVPLDC